MTDTFYFGHAWSWMETFYLADRPRGIDDLHLFVLAEILHHCFKLNGSATFKITHDTLAKFHFGRHKLRRYLEYLQDVGIITVEFRPRSSPSVELVHRPSKFTGGRKG